MEGAARIDPAVEIRQSELLLHETSNGKIGSASTCSSSRPAVCALVGLDTLGQVSGYGARRSSGGPEIGAAFAVETAATDGSS